MESCYKNSKNAIDEAESWYNVRMNTIYRVCKYLNASDKEAEFFTIIYGNQIKCVVNDTTMCVEIETLFTNNRLKIQESIKESEEYNNNNKLLTMAK